jgi:hypothetical protein
MVLHTLASSRVRENHICARVLLRGCAEGRGRSQVRFGSSGWEEMLTAALLHATEATEDRGSIDVIKTKFSSAHGEPLRNP